MLNNLKALVVIMGIAVIVFAVAKPFCLQFMTESDFVRRRNIWFALTITAFVSPSFWIFTAVALLVLVWGVRRDSNPLALSMLVFCIIPITIGIQIPVVGINNLFGINYYRILSLGILIPVAWRLLHSKEQKGPGKFTMIELLVLAYFGLGLALSIPYTEFTWSVRIAFLFFLDVFLLYFVVIRACSTRKAIVEVMASFCLLCAILASLAVFESLRGWLLYAELSSIWGSPTEITYLRRAGSLRAQVTAGQSIPMGYVLAFGFGIWLYLSSHMKSRFWIIAFGALMWAGMIATYARAPWIAAIAIFFIFIILGPNGTARFWKASLVFALLAGLVLISPIGGRVIDNLPFVGTIDQENVEYRQRLAVLSWEVVKVNPLFGDRFYLRNLESLRQGEGIIDLVNTYAQIAMSKGLIGLLLYLGPYLICLWTAFRLSRRTARIDPDLSLLGAALVACMISFLLAMGMGGFGPAPGNFSIVIIGLSLAYSRLGQQKETPGVGPSIKPGTQLQWNMKRG